jgi:phage tail-like protein
MPPINRIDPLHVGNFIVDIPVIGASAFSEVSGLDACIEVVDYREGNDPESNPRKLQGLKKFTNITLKRGLTTDLALWTWFQNGLTGSVEKVDFTISLRDQSDVPVLTWKVRNAWPCKWFGPTLSANSSDVAIETLEICHEGIELVVA